MSGPDSTFVEIEFTAGTWTDVSAWVDWSAGLSTKYGRSQPGDAPQTASLSLTLDNTDGRFSPLAQTLADRVTPHPYWPNVVPRRRIRFGYTVAGARYLRFTGYINGWPPTFKGQRGRRVTISASDRLQQLAQITMTTPYAYEVNADDPALYWPLTDPQGSTSAAEASGGPALQTVLPSSPTPLPPPTFGVDGPGEGNGTAVQFASVNGSCLAIPPTRRLSNLLTNLSLEVWVKVAARPAAYQSVMSVLDSVQGAAVEIGIDTSAQLFANVTQPGGSPSVLVPAGAALNLGEWAHLVVTLTAAGTLSLYLNGVRFGSAGGAALSFNGNSIYVGYGQFGAQYGGVLDGAIGQAAVYPSVLSATRVAAHTHAGVAWHNGLETVDQRVSRFLDAASVTSRALGVSSVKLSSYPQEGQSVLAGCQDMAATEGDTSVVYADPTDTVVFHARRVGQTNVPDAVLDAAGDLDVSTWSPSFNADQLVNSSTVSRATLSGVATTQTVLDADSVSDFGLTTEEFTTYTTDDGDALYNAQQRIASRSQPAFRLSQVTVDLLTAQTATLSVDLADAWIGARLRITNIDPGAAPASTLDLIVEGWSDSVSDVAYSIMFDTSPADNPTLAIADDAVYGLAATQDQTLAAAVDRFATALTFTVVSPLEPQFSLAAADYPMTVLIGQEQITLTAPPATLNPTQQRFVGVTRGAGGTAAASQAAGSDVELYPMATATL